MVVDCITISLSSKRVFVDKNAGVSWKKTANSGCFQSNYNVWTKLNLLWLKLWVYNDDQFERQYTLQTSVLNMQLHYLSLP